MCLFDYNYTEDRVNKFETNHLHMIIDGNIDYPFSNMETKEYSIFFHEYIHYLQTITTLYGIKMFSMYNSLFVSFIQYLRTNKTIRIPIRLEDENQNIKNFIERHNNVYGTKENRYNIDDIEIDEKDIEEARKNKTAIPISSYDFENDKINEKSFKFGYISIIESMAHMLQKLYTLI